MAPHPGGHTSRVVPVVVNMTSPRVAISIRVHRQVLDRLRPRCDIIGNRTPEPWTHEELIANACHAHALLAFMPDRVDDAMLKRCLDLGIVACALKGYDNFDIEACTHRGVWVTVVPDLLTAPTAELAVGLLIALARNVGAGDRFVRSGAFQGWRPALYGAGLYGSTVGILGAGRVGIAVAERLHGFRCARILCVDPQPLDAGIVRPGKAGQGGNGVCDDPMKPCLSSSGCETRPAKGEPARPVASLAPETVTDSAKRRHASEWAVGR